jgi:hypothetical protein
MQRPSYVLNKEKQRGGEAGSEEKKLGARAKRRDRDNKREI